MQGYDIEAVERGLLNPPLSEEAMNWCTLSEQSGLMFRKSREDMCSMPPVTSLFSSIVHAPSNETVTRSRRRSSSIPNILSDHSFLLSDRECRMALTFAHMDQGWLFQDEDDLLETSSKASDLKTGRDLLVHGIVCVVLVLVNANDTLLKSISQQRAPDGEKYSPSSVMLASNLISLLIGNGLCVLQQAEGLNLSHRLSSLRNFWTGSQILHMSLPAVFFTLSGTLKFIALGLVPPDVVMTLEQSTVLLCALMGWAWLGKSYSVLQVAMLVQMTLGFLWYQSSERAALGAAPAGASERLSHYWAGVALMSASVVAVTAGGLSCEKLIKGPSNRPFFVQKAQMEFSMAVTGLLYGFVLQPLLQGSSPLWTHGIFFGWDRRVVLVLCLHTGKSWLATTTVRMLDNLTYTLACNAAMLLVYLERLLFLDGNLQEHFRPEVFAALGCTALGAAGFAAASAWRWSRPRAEATPRGRRGGGGGARLRPVLSRQASQQSKA